jgi:two-component system sensor histidine kinase/response regulator
VGYPFLLFAQNSKQNLLDSTKTAQQVDSLNKLAFNRKSVNVLDALNILSQAKDLAEKINYHKGLTNAYYTEAGIFQQNGFNKRAHLLYEIALDNSLKYDDTVLIPKINIQIAAYQVLEGKVEDAIKLYNQSMAACIKLGQITEVANIKNSLGLIEIKKKNYAKAEALFKEALILSQEKKFPYGQKKSYYNLGLLASAKKDIATARLNFNNSIAFDTELNDYYGMSLNQLQLAQLLLAEHKLNDAIVLAKKAYDNARKTNAYSLMTSSMVFIKDIYKSEYDLENTINWQDSLINTLKLKADNEVDYANNFIALVKDKEIQKLNTKKEIEKANKRVSSQVIIIIGGTFLLLILAMMVIFAFISYRKQMLLSRRLYKQNSIIEENAASLDNLNKEINSKNLLLEEDNRTKDKLLSIISHDLRNPITNTQTILSLINKGALSPEESKVLLEQLETQYINTTGLLDNLLGWLKSQITGKELEKSDMNIYDLMNGMHLEQKIPLMHKRIKFINITHNDTVVKAEKDMIKIIFRNLISNAIKFTPLDGRIEITNREDEQYHYVMIRDSGIGMSEEVLSKVNAQKYFTRTGTLQEKGSGFGLILCRDLLQKQGGNLLIDSAKGEGSVFTVQLPKAV